MHAHPHTYSTDTYMHTAYKHKYRHMCTYSHTHLKSHTCLLVLLSQSLPLFFSYSYTHTRSLPLYPSVIERVSTQVVVVRELFYHDISDLCAEQRSLVRGYKDCLPHCSSFSSTAAFLPQWICRDHLHFILLCKH